MVTKSCDWIDEVQPKVVAGVENREQKLERRLDRNKGKVGLLCGKAKKEFDSPAKKP